MALLIAKYRVAAELLCPLLNGSLKLVTFCDAQPVENLMAQLARARGLRTYTNQHGQYRILDQTNMSPDAEAYSNFVSDKLLCWGEATRKEFAFVQTPSELPQDVLMIDDFAELVARRDQGARAAAIEATLKTQCYLDALWEVVRAD